MSDVTYFPQSHGWSWWVLADGQLHVGTSFHVTKVSLLKAKPHRYNKSGSEQPLISMAQPTLFLLATVFYGPGFLNLGERTVIPLCSAVTMR